MKCHIKFGGRGIRRCSIDLRSTHLCIETTASSWNNKGEYQGERLISSRPALFVAYDSLTNWCIRIPHNHNRSQPTLKFTCALPEAASITRLKWIINAFRQALQGQKHRISLRFGCPWCVRAQHRVILVVRHGAMCLVLLCRTAIKLFAECRDGVRDGRRD